MIKNILLSKTTIRVVSLVLIAILSIFVFTKIAISPEFHAGTIKILDEKKVVVAELTAATAAASFALSSVPGDVTTPMANQIMELSSYLMIVVCAILLEKILLTLTGYITFSFLIPLSCIFGIVNIFRESKRLKKWAIKLVTFGMVIFMLVPISAGVASVIDKTLDYQYAIEEVKESTLKINEEADKLPDDAEQNWLDKAVSATKNFFSKTYAGIKETVQNTVNYLIDAIAGLIITACIIPITVLVVFLWLIKVFTGIDIKLPKIKRRKTEEKLEEKEELLIDA